jgi:hypothetical protein
MAAWTGRFPLFCCFCRKLSADDMAFSAEILGGRRCGDRQNSEIARCFAAVFRCSRNGSTKIVRAAPPSDPDWLRIGAVYMPI